MSSEIRYRIRYGDSGFMRANLKHGYLRMKQYEKLTCQSLLLLFLTTVFLFPSFLSAGEIGVGGLVLRSTGLDYPDGEAGSAVLVPSTDILWIVWMDNRNDPQRTGGELYLQGLTENRNILLADNGVLLEEMGWCPDKVAFGAVSDGEDGVIVCATHEEGEESIKIIQRFNVEGLPVWDEPLLFDDPLQPQYMIPGNDDGAVILFTLDDLKSTVVKVDNNGDYESWDLFEEPLARSVMPVGIVPRTGGYLVIARIVISANSSELRRVLLNNAGEPTVPAEGFMFYYGRVFESWIKSMETNQSVQLTTAEDFRLVGQYFTSTGYPTWEFMGIELALEGVDDVGVCGSGNEFWMQVRQIVDETDEVWLRCYSNSAEPVTDTVILTDNPAHIEQHDPILDGGGGFFTIHHDENETEPFIVQRDESGEPWEEYDPPQVLDDQDIESEALYATRAFHDLFVIYVQDRVGEGQNSLVIQDFVNMVPDNVDEYAESTIPGRFEISSIYPNPFNGALRMDLKGIKSGEVQVSVYDVLGRLILDREFSIKNGTALSVPLSLDNLSSGGYIIRTKSGSEYSSQRVNFIK